MRPKQAPLYDPEYFRSLGHEIIDILADHLKDSLETKRPQVLPWRPPDQQMQHWKEIDHTDMEPKALFQEILSHSISIHDPRYIGHQVGMPAPTSLLFDLLSSYLNNGMAVYEMGMAANCMERLIIETLCSRFGLPTETAGGVLTSGGTLANLTAMLSARKAMASRWQGKRPAVMVSEEAHYCIERAAMTMGWAQEDVIKVPTDERFSMQTQQLEPLYQEALGRGQQVIAVIGCACSTSTGSYDDLATIGEFCNKHKIWFHVDGAHGAAAIFSPTYAHLLEGIAKADSIVLDFHKLLMAPALATALLYRKNDTSFQTFQQQSAYLLDLQQDWYNSGKRTFECTKYMMCAGIYGFVKAHGWESFGENVTTLFQHAKAFATQITQHPHMKLATPVQSNIICFRYEEEGLSTEETNQQNAFIRQAILENGVSYIVQTTLRNKLFLRLAVMNPFTNETHIEALCKDIEAYALQWSSTHAYHAETSAS